MLNKNHNTPGFTDRLKSYPLYFVPHHAISRLVFWLTRLRIPLKNLVIRSFIRLFNVDMSDALQQDIKQFEHFNAFFTRELQADARPLCAEKRTIACPVDGKVSQAGRINDGNLFQAKGWNYSLLELLGGDKTLTGELANGYFATLYLSPRDYHRIHMPVSAVLTKQIHVPGRLFSVAPHTVNTIPRLFARNERVIAAFTSEHGPMVMVLVGAINVAAIETVWHGLVTPPAGKEISLWNYDSETAVRLKKGDEMGRFNMGSTVILLFNSSIQWNHNLQNGLQLKMGEKIGSIR